MEVKSKIFIVGACWLIVATLMANAVRLRRWPLCKNQKDLVGSFIRILKKYKTRGFSVKRPKRMANSKKWSVDCFLASFIKDENDEILLSLTIGNCCDSCMYPHYTSCVKKRLPFWECASDAYDCVYKCRNEASVVDAVAKAADLGLDDRKRRLTTINKGDSLRTRLTKLAGNIKVLQAKLWTFLRRYRRREQCYKKECTGSGSTRKCCLIKTCLSVKELHKIRA